MESICEKNQCTGCMACVSACPRNAITICDNLSSYNAVIDKTECIDCGLCKKVCQLASPLELQTPISWVQGWSNDNDIRTTSSSGGFASAIMKAFLQKNGLVYSCYFDNGEFRYKEARTIEDIKEFSGSKYVKSNPINVFSLVKDELKKGNKCLFVGLPCHVAGLKNYIGKHNSVLLYTVDLICHGTPSPNLLKLYLEQHGVDIKKLDAISFRTKSQFGLDSKYVPLSKYNTADCYTIAFLNSLIYTQNCYSCKYARIERVSDLTLGDSWGSNLSDNEKKKGISLALCQTEKGKMLLQLSDLHTEPVDLKIAVSVNHQLEYPSLIPSKYDDFFDEIKKGKKFDQLVWKIYPKWCFRQFVKKILIKVDLFHGETVRKLG